MPQAGGTITVTVGEMGARNKTLELPPRASVGSALKKAGLSAKLVEQKRIRVNNVPTEKDKKLKHKDVVSVHKKVKGG